MNNNRSTANVLIVAGVFMLITSLLMFFVGPEFIQSKLQNWSIAERGQIGDAFGGSVGPVIAWFAAILTFAAFYIQYEANKEQRKQFERQNQDQIFFKLIESQELRVINSSFKDDDKEIKSYQLLEYIVNAFKHNIDKQCISLGRRLLIEKPEAIEDLYLMEMFKLNMLLNNEADIFITDHFSDMKKEFFEQILPLEKHDRGELLKIYFNSPGSEDFNQSEVLARIGRVHFYRISFDKRQTIYKNAFTDIELQYGSFLDGYLRGMEFIYLFASKSLNEDSYRAFLTSQLSKFEMIILFYYMASGYSNNEFISFVKKNNFLKNLHYYNSFLVDIPSRDQINSDLQCIYKM